MLRKNNYTLADLESLDQLKIFEWIYNKPLKLGCKVQNLTRDDKSLGSAFIIQGKSGCAIFYDHATNESYNALKYYMKISSKKLNDAIHDICSANRHYISSPTIINRETEIFYVKRRYTSKDIEYWESYGITKSMLSKDNVYSISSYSVNNSYYQASEYCYALVLNDRVKIYQPFFAIKWKGNVKSSDYWEFKQKSNIAIITSSYKDARVIFNNSSFDVYAPQSERKILPQGLDLSSYSKVYILYNGDTAGVENSKSLADKYGYTHVDFPIDATIINIYDKKTKDYAELYRYDRDVTNSFFEQLLQTSL